MCLCTSCVRRAIGSDFDNDDGGGRCAFDTARNHHTKPIDGVLEQLHRARDVLGVGGRLRPSGSKGRRCTLRSVIGSVCVRGDGSRRRRWVEGGDGEGGGGVHGGRDRMASHRHLGLVPIDEACISSGGEGRDRAADGDDHRVVAVAGVDTDGLQDLCSLLQGQPHQRRRANLSRVEREERGENNLKEEGKMDSWNRGPSRGHLPHEVGHLELRDNLQRPH